MTTLISSVDINGISLVPMEYQGQRTVTLTVIDQVHGRPDGTARRNFNENKHRLIRGKHYFQLSYDDVRSMYEFRTLAKPKGLTLITKAGYLLLVKSFTDDLAWKVQELLVDCYFLANNEQQKPLDNQVLTNPHQLRHLLLSYTERVIKLEAENSELEAKNSELQPKAQFHDAVATAINCQTIQEVAKVLGMGERTLFKYLRDTKLLMPDNLPYQEYLNRGYFKVVEKQYFDKIGESRTYTRTLVTGKGLSYIQQRIGLRLVS